MKEYSLNKEDYFKIKNLAKNNWVNRGALRNDNNYLCKCYVDAIITYCNEKNYAIKDGKIYKK